MPILRRRKQEVLTHAFLSDQYANSGNAKIEADAWQRWIDLHRPWNVTDSVEDVTSGSLGCVISLTHQLGVESGVAPLSRSLFLSEQTDDNDHHRCGSGGTQVKMNTIKKWMSCNLWRKVNVCHNNMPENTSHFPPLLKYKQIQWEKNNFIYSGDNKDTPILQYYWLLPVT